MCLSLEFFEKKNKDLPKVLKHLALCPGGLTNNDLIRIMPNWAKYVPILIKKSFIVEKPRINKEDPTVKKTNKSNKRQKIYQIDRSLSILILDSMDQEEINEYDKKIVQIIVDSSKHKWFNYFDPIEILEIYEENIWAAINRMTYSGKYEHNIREFNKADTINIDATIEGDTKGNIVKHMQTMFKKSSTQNIANVLSNKMIKRKESNNKKFNKLFDLCFSSIKNKVESKVSEVHKEEEKKEEEKKEVQDPDSSFNSGSYSGEDEFSSIHDLVDKPVTNEKLAHFSTMRVKPSHNFGKTGDSGATKYPKAAMDTNNILHRETDFDTYFLGTQPEQKFKNLSEIESDYEESECLDDEDKTPELKNRSESIEKEVHDVSSKKVSVSTPSDSSQQFDDLSNDSVLKTSSEDENEDSESDSDSEDENEANKIVVNSPTKQNISSFGKISNARNNSSQKGSVELETIHENKKGVFQQIFKGLMKPPALNVDAKSRSTCNEAKNGSRPIVKMTKEKKITSDQTTVIQKENFRAKNLDSIGNNDCPLHHQMIILFSTLLIRTNNYSESIKTLEQYGLAYLEDKLSRANVYKLLAINHILLQTPMSYTKALKY